MPRPMHVNSAGVLQPEARQARKVMSACKRAWQERHQGLKFKQASQHQAHLPAQEHLQLALLRSCPLRRDR